ncbi:MAG: sulfite exporter TauE/SafE family protein [Actinomycetota bacterium]|nr:sulfite exporter TauE/SafE family protein [Actinomycetota bacterium]
MDLLQHFALFGGGLGAGIVLSSIGAASLISFPILLAVGLPPVVANASNTVGLVPAGIGGAIGYRRELAAHPALARVVIATSAVGAVLGAFLLLRLPATVFEAIVPWLILFACALVGLQPVISGWVRRRAERLGHTPRDRQTMSVPFLVVSTVMGIYGGYFGAGQGVMMVAFLALGIDVELKVINALKTLAVFAANVVASIVFIAIADLDWTAIVLVGLGSIIGGYVGALIGRRLPPSLFRVLVVVMGLIVSLTLLLD